jgi:3-hydroxybutyryl-CoA dehydrogenase
LEGLADCDLVIEAIVERLDIKQSLLRQLESIVQADTVLASNTSSLSVAAMASCLEHPERVAGYHFFNPVPLMKIVEVVRAAKTSGHVVERLTALAKTVGHRAVVCGDTPGFIVNHAGLNRCARLAMQLRRFKSLIAYCANRFSLKVRVLNLAPSS